MLLSVYVILFAKIIFYQTKDTSKKNHPLSVIICAKNEKENLKRNLHQILQQDYSDFELIVVNDQSTDGSDLLLKEISIQFPHLKVIETDPSKDNAKGKKNAVITGINEAKNEWMVFTDADCYPKSNNWLYHINTCINDDVEIILGISPYEKKKGHLNLLIRFDSIHIAFQYISMAILRRPYMGVGRNMAYRKSLFYRIDGFESHKEIASGDDDLFVNEGANASNTTVCLHPDSFMFSVPENNYSAWWKQKTRHFTTSSAYKKKHKLVLQSYGFGMLLFYLTLIIGLLFSPEARIYLLTLLLLKTVSQYIIFKPILKQWRSSDLLLFTLYFDFIMSFLNPAFVIGSWLNKNKKWK